MHFRVRSEAADGPEDSHVWSSKEYNESLTAMKPRHHWMRSVDWQGLERKVIAHWMKASSQSDWRSIQQWMKLWTAPINGICYGWDFLATRQRPSSGWRKHSHPEARTEGNTLMPRQQKFTTKMALPFAINFRAENNLNSRTMCWKQWVLNEKRRNLLCWGSIVI